MNRLNKHFDEIIRYDLISKDHLTNVMQIPHLNKIVLNIGLGQKLIANKKEIVKTLLALELIGNQRAVATKAKKSIDKFKLKKKMMIGSKLTLRRRNMFFFLDRLTNDVLPNLENLEDFHRKYKKGFSIKSKSSSLVNKKISRNCSWSVGFGLPDFFSFKEIPFDKFDSTYGLDISLNIKQGVNAKKGILVKKRKSYNLGTQSLGATEKVFKKPFYSKISSNDSVFCTKSKKGSIKNKKTFSLNMNPLEFQSSNQYSNKVLEGAQWVGGSNYNYFLSSFQFPLSSSRKF